jgi:hypothetical protein
MGHFFWGSKIRAEYMWKNFAQFEKLELKENGNWQSLSRIDKLKYAFKIFSDI